MMKRASNTMWFTPALAASVALVLGTTGTSAGQPNEPGNFCTQTANTLYKACGFELLDDYYVALAKCTNESNSADRVVCRGEAASARSEKALLCRETLQGRKDFCRAAGEARYDPDFDQQLFETDYTHLPNLNPFFPIQIGNHWEFAGGAETVTVEILNQTKLIDDVTCIVSRDLVSRNGTLVEATDDWLAQAKDGNIWYCGEEVKDYEAFAGDRPAAPELVSIDGTFKVSVDGAKAGILYQRHPIEGQVYREEFSVGNAEDISKIESDDYTYGSDLELDQWVPAALGLLLCGRGGCVVTENQNLKDPGDLSLKYYTPGIGVFLEVHPDTGETVQITGCNMDPRCSRLPIP